MNTGPIPGTEKTFEDIEGLLKDVWKSFYILGNPLNHPKEDDVEGFQRHIDDKALFTDIETAVDFLVMRYRVSHPSKNNTYRPLPSCGELYQAVATMGVEYLGDLEGDMRTTLNAGINMLRTAVVNILFRYEIAEEKDEMLYLTELKEQPFVTIHQNRQLRLPTQVNLSETLNKVAASQSDDGYRTPDTEEHTA